MGDAGTERDKWAEWVLSRSHGGDAGQKQRWLDFLRPIRDRVLTHAELVDGGELGADDGAHALSMARACEAADMAAA